MSPHIASCSSILLLLAPPMLASQGGPLPPGPRAPAALAVAGGSGAIANPGTGTNLVVNGDLEAYAGGSCDSNLLNAQFTALMSDAEAFGAADELDVYANPPCYGEPAPSGLRKVGMHATGSGAADAFSLRLSAVLLAGQSYELAFLMESVMDFAPGLGRIEIGLSNNPSFFGTLVYTANSTVADAWQEHSTTFVAPINGDYLTVQAARADPAQDCWLHVDAFHVEPAEQPAPRLFGVNSGTGGGFLAVIDKNTGALTNIGGTGITCDGLTFGPDGTLYAADNGYGNLVTLDPDTGAIDTVIGSFGFGGIVEGLAAHPFTGELWGLDVIGDNLLKIDEHTGQATILGQMHSTGSMAGLSWSADGSHLYAISWSSGCLFQLNPLTGNGTLIGCGNANEPLGLATDPVDGQLYSADWANGADMTLSRVDSTNGSRYDVGLMVGGLEIEGLSFEPGELGTPYCIATLNSTGYPAGIEASGTTSVAKGNLRLDAVPVPNQNGIFFHAQNQAEVSFGNGYLCAAGGIVRGAVINATANQATYVYDNSTSKRSLTAFVGNVRHFQYWFRDPMGGGAFFNTSNAVSLPIFP